MKKPRKIVSAPQIKQKLVEPIQEIFLSRVLEIEGAYITDETYISDFRLFPPEEALGPGKEPGTMRFRKSKPVMMSGLDDEAWKKLKSIPRKDWPTEIVEAEPDISLEEIVAKTKEIFGVDISERLREPLVDILLFIAENYRRKDKGDEN